MTIGALGCAGMRRAVIGELLADGCTLPSGALAPREVRWASQLEGGPSRSR